MGKPRRAGPTKAPAADPLVPPLRKKKKIPKERHCFSGWVLGYSNQDGLGGAIRSVIINSFTIVMEIIILTGGNFESRPFSPSARSHPFHPGSRPVTELCTLSASWERSSLVFSGSIAQSFAFRCGRRVSRMGNCTSKDKERGGSRQMLKKSPPEGNQNHKHSMPWLSFQMVFC